jgi:rare lipoprotein A
MVDHYRETGVASWYGAAFHGRKTANGEVYDMHAISAAHPTLPLPSLVRVTNLQNGRSIVVRINDRGPFAKRRIIDLSRRAAWELGFKDQGTTDVEVVYLGLADGLDRRYRQARRQQQGPMAALN